MPIPCLEPWFDQDITTIASRHSYFSQKLFFLVFSKNLNFSTWLLVHKYHCWSADIWFIVLNPGAAMFAPMANPYDSKMTKDERHKTWDSWSTKRKLMHILARRFPSLLPLFYRRSFLSGKQGQADSWLSLSLGKKVCQYHCYVLPPFQITIHFGFYRYIAFPVI
jgi:hypothetical protein